MLGASGHLSRRGFAAHLRMTAEILRDCFKKIVLDDCVRTIILSPHPAPPEGRVASVTRRDAGREAVAAWGRKDVRPHAEAQAAMILLGRPPGTSGGYKGLSTRGLAEQATHMQTSLRSLRKLDYGARNAGQSGLFRGELQSPAHFFPCMGRGLAGARRSARPRIIRGRECNQSSGAKCLARSRTAV
jgi:hypothetical protein